MALPGVFAPVSIMIDDQEHCLLDDGLVNNVPTKQVQGYDVVLASDVISVSNNVQLKAFSLLNSAINIMVKHATTIRT